MSEVAELLAVSGLCECDIMGPWCSMHIMTSWDHCSGFWMSCVEHSNKHGNNLQACKRPPASRESLLCMLHALLESTLTLGGLFQAAASGAAPAQANAWLQAHVEGCLMRSAASLARTVAEQYKQSAPAHQQVQRCSPCPVATHSHPYTRIR